MHINHHFAERVRDRISKHLNPDALWLDLSKAIREKDRWFNYIERVIKLSGDRCIYRFRVAEGIYYVLAERDHPLTIITQEMLKQYKSRRR